MFPNCISVLQDCSYRSRMLTGVKERNIGIQVPSLTKHVNSILHNYPEGGQILKVSTTIYLYIVFVIIFISTTIYAT